MTSIILWTLLAIDIVLVIMALVKVLLEELQPFKAMFWVMTIIFVPILGLVLFFFFGKNLHKKRLLSDRTHMLIAERIYEGFTAQDDLVIPARHERVINFFARLTLAFPFKNNRIEILSEGSDFFLNLLHDIGQAQSHIHLITYIFTDDALGRLVADALIDKAREGVEVRVIYDDVGSWETSNRFFERLRGAGVDVVSFMPVRFPAFTGKVNYRNHRKIAVIDGRVGFIGGMNIADRYVRGTEWGSWRDTHFRVEGSGAAGLQVSFLSDWSATTKQHITGADYFPQSERHTDNILQIVPSGPFGQWRALLQADSYAVSNARRRIWIQTPYYLPSDVLNTALQVAALAGVDVRLMLPARSDSKIVDLASHSYLDDMMKAGVKILFYKPGFLHSKLLIIDDMLTVIGSANMDFRSFEHNFEINAFVYDPEFTARMDAVFRDDASHCHALTPGEWFNRPRPRRWAESLMRVFSPLL